MSMARAHPRSIIARAVATAGAFCFVIAAVAATPPTPQLDVSACAKHDGECVTLLKNIETIKLLHEQETLSLEMERAKLADFIEAKAHRNNVFHAQFIASWIILVLVIAIVGAGLFMSWRQLVHGLKIGNMAVNRAEMGPEGIKIESAVIGLVIFLASIVFFSIYIDKVYTITVLNERSDAKPPVPPEPGAPKT